MACSIPAEVGIARVCPGPQPYGTVTRRRPASDGGGAPAGGAAAPAARGGAAGGGAAGLAGGGGGAGRRQGSSGPAVDTCFDRTRCGRCGVDDGGRVLPLRVHLLPHIERKGVYENYLRTLREVELVGREGDACISIGTFDSLNGKDPNVSDTMNKIYVLANGDFTVGERLRGVKSVTQEGPRGKSTAALGRAMVRSAASIFASTTPLPSHRTLTLTQPLTLTLAKQLGSHRQLGSPGVPSWL